jgi:STE24 endopeptidase
LPAWLVGGKPGPDGAETAGLITNVPMLLLFALYIFIVFGFLSRRCERQADVYGSRTMSIPVFVEALEKVARINGIHREKPGWLSSWLHSTIAKRVEFLERVHVDPVHERRFQKRVRTLQLATLMVLVCVLGGLCYLAGADNVWAFMQSQQLEPRSQSRATSYEN